jgi:V/A-type H+/Na+-transporting ATPase subunit D
LKLAVNPNRMELLKLRRRTVLARRGHKLLKDKQEQLVRIFFGRIEEAKALRTEVEEGLRKVQEEFLIARSRMAPEELDAALAFPKGDMAIKVSVKSLMNVRVPKFEISGKPDPYSYGLARTSVSLDRSLGELSRLYPVMIRLAEAEAQVEVLAQEIERTRRRVNALEYVLIPSLEDTVRYITMKLGEIERSNLTQLMRVKQILEDK